MCIAKCHVMLAPEKNSDRGGSMKKKLAAGIIALLLLSTGIVWAQNSADPFAANHRKGSQSIEISPGGFLPLFVLDSNFAVISSPNMSPGAAFSVLYRYMLGKNLGIGGSIAGSFVTTVGGRTLFLAPVCLSSTYVFGTDPMEFDISTEIGMNVMRLSGNGIISPIAKLGGGISRYISESWSIGGKLMWWFVPEIHLGSYANLDSYANFLEFSIGAQYHF